MDDKKTFNFKDKKWSDLQLKQKIIFIASLVLMLGTLIFMTLNFKTLLIREDIITENTGCTYTFINGYLDNLDCRDKHINESILNIKDNYSIADYYDDKKQKAKTLGFYNEFEYAEE